MTQVCKGKQSTKGVREIADHFNGYFTSIAGELNQKIVKFKNMHLSYLGSMKENNIFLTTTLNDIKILIGNMKVSKGVGSNSIPTKILKDYKSELSTPLSDMIKYFFYNRYIPQCP